MSMEKSKGSLSFDELRQQSLMIIEAFEKVEKRKCGAEGAMIELTKQVGALAENIMIFEGYYMAGRDKVSNYRASKQKIADELSDVLLMVIRIAAHYDIDLEKEHLRQLDIAIKHPLMKVKEE